MKAHIVGGGFGGLAAAAYLIQHAQVPGRDITVYEAYERMGGSFSLGGNAKDGYILPCGAIFDSEFRCTFDLLATIPSLRNPDFSVKCEFFAFNKKYPFHDRAHIIDRNGQIVPHNAHFGLGLRDGFDLVRLALTPKALLDGKRIEEFFSPKFFATEFWLLWSTIMGSLPQHGATEFKRYINRALALFPDLSDMTGILRTQLDQYEAFIVPLVAWLQQNGVNLLTSTFVRDIGLAPSPDRITVNRLDCESAGAMNSVAVAADDIVLLTTGSEAADLAVGSMTDPPRPPQPSGRSWELWQRLAQGRNGFGNPDVFFGAPRIPLSRWVSFTLTTHGPAFVERLAALTNSEPGSGGLVTLKDSNWMLSLSMLHHPEVINQPDDTNICWGYGLFPQQIGNCVQKPMHECTGAEILKELLWYLHFNEPFDIICIPCDLPYVNNIWMPRQRTDRPAPVPEGATNLGLIGQYVEVPQDVAFTIEYSARTAWDAIHRLLKRGPAPPSVYQAQYDPKALFNALKVFVSR
jgi:oleate hydratase